MQLFSFRSVSFYGMQKNCDVFKSVYRIRVKNIKEKKIIKNYTIIFKFVKTEKQISAPYFVFYSIYYFIILMKTVFLQYFSKEKILFVFCIYFSPENTNSIRKSFG